MSQIVLPGYRAVVPDRVFYRDQTTQLNGKPVQLNSDQIQPVLIVERYFPPTKQDIRDKLPQIARNILSRYAEDLFDFIGIDSSDTEEDGEYQKLEAILSEFPGNIILRLAKREEYAMRALEQSMPYGIPENKSHDLVELHIRYGKIPIQTLALHKPKNSEMGYDFYDSALGGNIFKRDGLGILWSASVSLVNCRLPERSLIESFIEERVATSKRFVFNCLEEVDLEDVRDVFNAIYNGLSSYEDLLKLYDVSQKLFFWNSKALLDTFPKTIDESDSAAETMEYTYDSETPVN